MPLGMEVGLGPGHTVLDGDPAPPPPRKRHSSAPLFGHVYRGQTTGIKRIPLGQEVGFGPGDMC